MEKEGGGRNPVPQSLHLCTLGNEAMGGMKCGGCVNLAVVPNESRSYFEDFLRLSAADSMLQRWTCILNRSAFSACTCSAVKYIKFSTVRIIGSEGWADLAVNFTEPFAVWCFTAVTESRDEGVRFCRCLCICRQGPQRGMNKSFLLFSCRR